jgi:hypothetical protein
LLRRASLLLAAVLALATCTSTDEPPPSTQDGRPYVAAYFVRNDFLVPQFRPLPKGDPVRALFGLLAAGPTGQLLHTAVPADSAVLQEAEPQEGELVLDLDDAFWEGNGEEIRTRAAQVVFTLAGLEEGRAITLLDGSIPARITAANGEELKQPLSAEDFPSPRPLLQVVRPQPGATVPDPIPVALVLPKGVRAWGIVSIDEVIGSKTRLRNGTGVLRAGTDGTRKAKIIFVALRGSDRVAVSVPVTISS